MCFDVELSWDSLSLKNRQLEINCSDSLFSEFISAAW